MNDKITSDYNKELQKQQTQQANAQLSGTRPDSSKSSPSSKPQKSYYTPPKAEKDHSGDNIDRATDLTQGTIDDVF